MNILTLAMNTFNYTFDVFIWYLIVKILLVHHHTRKTDLIIIIIENRGLVVHLIKHGL